MAIPVTFLHLFEGKSRMTCPKMNEFSFLYPPFYFERAYNTLIIFSKSLYLTAHLNINYPTGRTKMCSEKNLDVSRTIATSIIELFMTLVSAYLIT